ncbi:hypothetical protein LCGC14_3102540 [marine sediment metagenome]|uniref:Peptidase M15A C-terminal domain-containing protein n=1 Tax=marine sediment metagenome TaxID=412755 RepID=A0A0F8W7Q5_9ZZZZ
MIDWSDYPNFTEAEMRCKGFAKGLCSCGGQADMKPSFMMTLQRVRNAFGRPMVVNSGFRCPDYDKFLGGAGIHPKGRAADIRVSGENAYHLLGCAYAMDVWGIGLKQHGPWPGRFMHLDTMSGPKRPRIWSYT